MSDESIIKGNEKIGYTFLDHPADVHVHAWGSNYATTFEQCAYALMDTMTDPESISEVSTHTISVAEPEIGNLLVLFLSEFLFLFDTE